MSAQSDFVAADGDQWLGGRIGLVSFCLIVCVNPFVRGHMNLVVFGRNHVHSTTVVDDMQAATGRKILLQLVFVTVAVTEQRQIFVPKIDVVADLIPVE